jgi:thymidylate kinase
LANNPSINEKLIAVEGFCGREVETVARTLQKHFCRKGSGGVSRWDSSGIFYELEQSDFLEHPPSPRTLMLLYAADLSFRLQWHIRPALKDGQCVIAAPYIESAIAFGKSVDLPPTWLDALFRFAPPAGTIYRIQEPREMPKRIKPMDGFAEFAYLALRAGSHPWSLKELRQKFVQHMFEQEKQGLCRTIPKRLLGGACR